jgi:hypothetical protein
MDPSLKGKSTENGTLIVEVCPKSWLPNQENGKRERREVMNFNIVYYLLTANFPRS